MMSFLEVLMNVPSSGLPLKCTKQLISHLSRKNETQHDSQFDIINLPTHNHTKFIFILSCLFIGLFCPGHHSFFIWLFASFLLFMHSLNMVWCDYPAWSIHSHIDIAWRCVIESRYYLYNKAKPVVFSCFLVFYPNYRGTGVSMYFIDWSVNYFGTIHSLDKNPTD